jgi:hypothetical protein
MTSWWQFACFVSIPFLIGAAFHFGGHWIGWPALFVGGIWWLGICGQISERKP